jgi:hypothetical protein
MELLGQQMIDYYIKNNLKSIKPVGTPYTNQLHVYYSLTNTIPDILHRQYLHDINTCSITSIMPVTGAGRIYTTPPVLSLPSIAFSTSLDVSICGRSVIDITRPFPTSVPTYMISETVVRNATYRIYLQSFHLSLVYYPTAVYHTRHILGYIWVSVQ